MNETVRQALEERIERLEKALVAAIDKSAMNADHYEQATGKPITEHVCPCCPK